MKKHHPTMTVVSVERNKKRYMMDRLRLVLSESGLLMSTGPHIARAGSAPRILRWPGIVTMGLG